MLCDKYSRQGKASSSLRVPYKHAAVSQVKHEIPTHLMQLWSSQKGPADNKHKHTNMQDSQKYKYIHQIGYFRLISS